MSLSNVKLTNHILPSSFGLEKDMQIALYALNSAIGLNALSKLKQYDKKNIENNLNCKKKHFEKKDIIDIIEATEDLYGTLFVSYNEETAFISFVYHKNCRNHNNFSNMITIFIVYNGGHLN